MKRKLTKAQVADYVFKPLYDLLFDIDSGEVNEVDGSVVIYCNELQFKDTWASASTFLHIWCEAFVRIASVVKRQVKVESLREIANSLRQETVVIEESLLNSAREELTELKKFWCLTPNSAINKGLKTLNAKQLEHIV